MPRLENWTIMARTDLYGNKYKRLVGNVYGYPKANDKSGKLRDGNNILTSEVITIDLDEGFAVTRDGVCYELGVRSDVKSL